MKLLLFALAFSLPFSSCAPATEIKEITPTPSIIATPTSLPTTIPSPTVAPTEIPLSPQEQLERDYGSLVPLDENSLLFTNQTMNAPFMPSGAKFATLQFRLTGESKREMIPFGDSGELRASTSHICSL